MLHAKFANLHTNQTKEAGSGSTVLHSLTPRPLTPGATDDTTMGLLNFVKSFGGSGSAVKSGIIADAARSEVSAHTLGESFPEDEKFFGLENFGNTCYCNSVLQALYACEPFRRRLIEHREETTSMSSSGVGSKPPESLLGALGDLFHEISSQRKRTGYVAPKPFIDRLKMDNMLFRGHMHQDAHEFLNFLLNECCENLEKELKENGRYEPQQKTWIHDVFEGKLANQTRCLWCENTTNREECFLDLSVDIEQNSSITACLNNFSAKELLGKEDKFQCDRCGGLHEAQKRMLIQSVPNVLCLHLKRFKYIESIGRHAKLNHRVVFPAQLKIPNLVDDAVDPDAAYNLFAVVVHIGSGPNHGHYVCFAKRQKKWFLYDDDSVELVDEEQLQHVFGSTQDSSSGSEHGYILFYSKISTSQDQSAAA